MIRRPNSGPMDEGTRQVWADAHNAAALQHDAERAERAAHRDDVEVVITETTEYRHRYTRQELTGLLLRDGGWTAADLAAMTGPALARLVAEDRSPAVEEDMQRYGDVLGGDWKATAGPPGEDSDAA